MDKMQAACTGSILVLLSVKKPDNHSREQTGIVCLLQLFGMALFKKIYHWLEYIQEAIFVLKEPDVHTQKNRSHIKEIGYGV